MSYFASCRLGRLDSSSLAAAVVGADLAAAAVVAAAGPFDASHWALQRNAANSPELACLASIHFDCCSTLPAFDSIHRPPHSTYEASRMCVWRG